MMAVFRMARLLLAKQRPLLLLIGFTFFMYMMLNVFYLDSSGESQQLQEPHKPQQQLQQQFRIIEASAPTGKPLSRGLVERIARLGPIESNGMVSREEVVAEPVMIKKTRIIPEYRVFHLDLKGAPPKLSFLEALLPLVRAAGGNALLLEYEDMFPFEGALKNLSALNAYSRQDVKKIIALAKKNSLEVIPLVQTFGHLEFMLKLPEFKQLREVEVFPQEVCPSRKESFEIVQAIVRQVVAMHPDARWLHIGCDEVFHLGTCSTCTDRLKTWNRRLRNNGLSGEKDGRHIFLDHVLKVARFVKDKLNMQPIVWDDMFRHMSAQDLVESGLGDLVEPMVWAYTDSVDRLVPPYLWQMYAETFKNMWVASSFKGAFGETLHIPDLRKHLDNTMSWLDVMARESGRVHKFRGLVLTGWSRYDHFAVLCELLPQSVPSLALNMLATTAGGDLKQTFQKFNDVLGCPSGHSLLTLEQLDVNPYQWDLNACNFPGSKFYSLLNTYEYLVAEVKVLHQTLTEKQGWMTPYNVKHKFSSPWRVVEAMRRHPVIKGNVQELRENSYNVLSQYFDHYTVQEWLEQKLQPLMNQLNAVEEGAIVLLGRDVWPRRPIH